MRRWCRIGEYRVRFDEPLQQGGHQIVVVAHLVASVFLGEIQGLVGLAQDFYGRTFVGGDKTHADGDLPHLRKIIVFHVLAEAVEHLVCCGQAG